MNVLLNSAEGGKSGSCDVRAIAGGLRYVQPLARYNAATVWAETLMARYALRPLRHTGEGFVYRRPGPLVNFQSANQHTWLHLAPRLAFTLVQRLLTRRERIEAQRPAAAPVAAGQALPELKALAASHGTPSKHPPKLRPVPRVFRRPAVVAAAEDQQPAAPQRTIAQVPRSAFMREPIRPPETPIDVNRLTDQVIQNIDRRIIAQRERLGRV